MSALCRFRGGDTCAAGGVKAPSPSLSFFFLQVFVWIGNEAQEEEKTEAMSSGEEQADPVKSF